MKLIRKKPEPAALVDWKTANALLPQNLRYNAANFPMAGVRASLLSEQGHLCAYTQKRLRTQAECKDADTAESCHIEHILPQHRQILGEDIDYLNLLACFPPGRSKIFCDYGAQKKDRYDPDNNPFVSPLNPGVEAEFKYGRPPVSNCCETTSSV
ncbi:hypothetical protein [Massilia scottii]|uniref:hypothetical protein n=1 Tax=Massilia scottii TaxID=3057166 RepID=UPI002796E135|nr:hypothetical protein [Massilia sp. CCM 9029]MDQ1835581.1 hypothetical protein [Massilia sp. CCM 9029]